MAYGATCRTLSWLPSWPTRASVCRAKGLRLLAYLPYRTLRGRWRRWRKRRRRGWRRWMCRRREAEAAAAAMVVAVAAVLVRVRVLVLVLVPAGAHLERDLGSLGDVLAEGHARPLPELERESGRLLLRQRGQRLQHAVRRALPVEPVAGRPGPRRHGGERSARWGVKKGISRSALTTAVALTLSRCGRAAAPPRCRPATTRPACSAAGRRARSPPPRRAPG